MAMYERSRIDLSRHGWGEKEHGGRGTPEGAAVRSCVRDRRVFAPCWRCARRPGARGGARCRACPAAGRTAKTQGRGACRRRQAAAPQGAAWTVSRAHVRAYACTRNRGHSRSPGHGPLPWHTRPGAARRCGREPIKRTGFPLAGRPPEFQAAFSLHWSLAQIRPNQYQKVPKIKSKNTRFRKRPSLSGL